MNKFELNFAPKTIPVPPKSSFMKHLLFQTENFLRRLRWKAFFFDNPDGRLGKKETFGFITSASAPPMKDLQNFESDLYDVLANIKFRKITNTTLLNINKEAHRIRSSKNAIVPADKTSNFYEMDVEKYSELIHRQITSEYSKSNTTSRRKIDETSAKICQKLGIDDRVETFQSNPAYILLKDHKSNFHAKSSCRLINPAKSQIGRISKTILDRIIADLRKNLAVNQWKNTNEVLSWFEDKRTPKSVFLQFDVVGFYPNIREELYQNALDFAGGITKITEEELEILHHARQSLLFSPNGEEWRKKNGLFDVTMGSNDGAEVCELVGTYLLEQLAEAFPDESVRLYRDDGLFLIKHPNGPQLERIRKRLHEIFKGHGLEITTEQPSQVANFLDVTLNCRDGSFRPFRKENSITEYVHRHSNHPPHITRKIPEIVGKRLNSISSSRDIFNQAKTFYESSLRASGYKNCSLEYQDESNSKKRKRTRKRNIIWYNPPWNASVETDIGKKFFELLERHFPERHRYRKIINRNSVKLSYACTENLKAIILKKNRNLIQDEHSTNERKGMCNCRGGTESCPLGGECQKSDVIYEATIKTNAENFTYVGLTSETFKRRYNNHLCSFRNERYRSSTTLSQKVWDLKDTGQEFKITWRIIKSTTSYRGGGSGKCDLCLSEKEEILKRIKKRGCLNTRNELMGKCRHLKRTRLKTVLL